MFNYLIEKINQANFESDPFKHITIENFFNEKDFERIVTDNQIKRPVVASNESLIDDLLNSGYKQQRFPGCVTSIQKYLDFLNGVEEEIDRSLIPGYGKNIIESYGMTMRMNEVRSTYLADLISFLNDSAFQKCLVDKFEIEGKYSIETAYQKNLNGYEISPHADTRRKALTYMVNIYTSTAAEDMPIHTQLLRFIPQYQYIYDFWKHNPDVDRCWVPWSWCNVKKTTSKNNSITIFSPSYNTLHAVKLSYNHLEQQRNQIYGNLWYEAQTWKHMGDFQKLDLLKAYSDNTSVNS